MKTFDRLSSIVKLFEIDVYDNKNIFYTNFERIQL